MLHPRLRRQLREIIAVAARVLSEGALAPAYLAWAGVWIAVIWGLTALSFSRRDV